MNSLTFNEEVTVERRDLAKKNWHGSNFICNFDSLSARIMLLSYIMKIFLLVKVEGKKSEIFHLIDFSPQEIKVSRSHRILKSLPGILSGKNQEVHLHNIHNIKSQNLSPYKVIHQNGSHSLLLHQDVPKASSHNLLPVLLASLTTRKRPISESGTDYTNEDEPSKIKVKRKPELQSNLTKLVMAKVNNNPRVLKDGSPKEPNESILDEQKRTYLHQRTTNRPKNEVSRLITKEEGADYAAEHSDDNIKSLDNAQNLTKEIYTELHKSITDILTSSSATEIKKDEGPNVNMRTDLSTLKGTEEALEKIGDKNPNKEYGLPLTELELEAINILVRKRLKKQIRWT